MAARPLPRGAGTLLAAGLATVLLGSAAGACGVAAAGPASAAPRTTTAVRPPSRPTLSPAGSPLRLRPRAVRVPAKHLLSRSLPSRSLPSRSLLSRSLPSGSLPSGSLLSGRSPSRTVPSGRSGLRPRLSTLGSGTVGQAPLQPLPRAGTLPRTLTTFTSTYRVGGADYPLRMVGTDPQGPAVTTVVATTLVPVAVRAGGLQVAPTTATLATVTASGLFTARSLPGGTGQYGDVVARTQFWSVLGDGTRAWHVDFATPQVAAPLVLDVPAGKGLVRTVRGVRVAFVDVDWFDARLQPRVVAAGPDVFTQFLAGDVVLCQPFSTDLAGCGVGGYHSATTDGAGVHTYSYQAYLAPAVFGPGSGLSDLGPMSHELAEWLADPFTDNAVPPWTSPLAPQYGCVDALEPGDPVVGRYLTVDGLTYQDEAYLWWFLRSPSAAWQGRYTWLGSLDTPSQPC